MSTQWTIKNVIFSSGPRQESENFLGHCVLDHWIKKQSYFGCVLHIHYLVGWIWWWHKFQRQSYRLQRPGQCQESFQYIEAGQMVKPQREECPPEEWIIQKFLCCMQSLWAMVMFSLWVVLLWKQQQRTLKSLSWFSSRPSTKTRYCRKQRHLRKK